MSKYSISKVLSDLNLGSLILKFLLGDIQLILKFGKLHQSKLCEKHTVYKKFSFFLLVYFILDPPLLPSISYTR